MRYWAIALLGWLATASCDAQAPTDPGHLFIPVGKTYPSYSSWAVTLSINIIPYRMETAALSQARDDLLALAFNLRERHLDVNKTLNSTASNAMVEFYANQLDAALTELNSETNGLRRTFRDILYPPKAQYPEGPSDRRIKRVLPAEPLTASRPKRGLINGIGNALSYLFGTATESEIKHLTRNVKLINQKDMAIAHRFKRHLEGT